MVIHSAKDIGALVRHHRQKRGWTQRELAARIGIQPLWISQFERGKATAQIGLVLRTLKALDLYFSAGNPRATETRDSAIDLDALIDSASPSVDDFVKLLDR